METDIDLCMAVQYVCVMYVCDFAVDIPTVPVVPVGLTTRPFVGQFLHDLLR